jgi:hypothetical protein
MLLLPAMALALTTTNYSATVNDRFTSGFPNDPVSNTAGTFIGLDYDWSGVAWSTTTYASSSYKGFGLLSPLHFLTAQHYEKDGNLTQGIRILDNTNTVQTRSNASITNLGQGLFLEGNHDLAIGTLTQPVDSPTQVARYAVLDLNNTSSTNTLSNYNNLSLLLYGRSNSTNGSPRIAATPVNQIGAFASDPNQLVILTTRDDVQLQSGDSGSPAMHGWTNPNGDKQ